MLPAPTGLKLLGIAIGIATVTASILGCGGGGQGKPAGDDPTVLARYRVERGDLDITITENGQLKSAKPVLITVRESGKVLWVVKEGVTVAKGDKLIELENRDLTNQNEQAGLDLENVKRAFANAEAEKQLYDLEADKLVKDADRALIVAKMNLEQYRDGKAPLREEELILDGKRAAVDRDDAKDKAERMPALLAKGFVTAVESRAATIDAEQKEAAARRKVRELEIFRTFERPQELAKLEGEVTAAELARKRVEQQVAATRGQKDGEFVRQRSLLERQKRLVADFADRLARLVVIAPSDGLVVFGNPNQRWNQITLDIGTDINRNATLMELPDLNAMVAEVGVNETNINRVAVDQPVTITIEGLGGKAFPGRVSRINATAQQQNWWGDEVKKYDTTIELNAPAGTKFKPGMSVKAQILLARLPKVLHVPVNAVTTRAGVSTVWIAGPGDQPQRHQVTLGQAGTERVEVREGLNEGDTVLVLSVEPSTPVSSVPAVPGGAKPDAASTPVKAVADPAGGAGK